MRARKERYGLGNLKSVLTPGSTDGHDLPTSYAEHFAAAGEDPIAAAEEARGRPSWCESQEQILTNIPNGKVHIRRDVVCLEHCSYVIASYERFVALIVHSV